MDDKRDQNPAKSSDPQTDRRRPHKGSFATGEERRVHHPEGAPPGDFARGQEEKPEEHEHEHKGSFAEGEEQTIELLQRLGSNRFVAVVGSSGSGKSSLVRCGLLSELRT